MHQCFNSKGLLKLVVKAKKEWEETAHSKSYKIQKGMPVRKLVYSFTEGIDNNSAIYLELKSGSLFDNCN